MGGGGGGGSGGGGGGGMLLEPELPPGGGGALLEPELPPKLLRPPWRSALAASRISRRRAITRRKSGPLRPRRHSPSSLTSPARAERVASSISNSFATRATASADGSSGGRGGGGSATAAADGDGATAVADGDGATVVEAMACCRFGCLSDAPKKDEIAVHARLRLPGDAFSASSMPTSRMRCWVIGESHCDAPSFSPVWTSRCSTKFGAHRKAGLCNA